MKNAVLITMATLMTGLGSASEASEPTTVNITIPGKPLPYYYDDQIDSRGIRIIPWTEETQPCEYILVPDVGLRPALVQPKNCELPLDVDKYTYEKGPTK